MFRKQQERCIEFLQLSEDYANKHLLDIDAEIRQQSTLLNWKSAWKPLRSYMEMLLISKCCMSPEQWLL